MIYLRVFFIFLSKKFIFPVNHTARDGVRNFEFRDI